jgi:hypothetical protein
VQVRFSCRFEGDRSPATAQALSEVFRGWIQVQILDGNRKPLIAVLPAAPLCLADTHPVGSLITGADKTGSVDEGFNQA